MELEFIRGDTFPFKIIRKTEDHEIIKEKPDEMFFTVKKNYSEKEYKFQKRLSNGTIIYDEETNYYNIIINPEDTNNLDFGKYVYDIEIKQGDIIKTILIGELKIKHEVTSAENEV